MAEALETAVIELAVKKLASQGYHEIKSAMDLESEVQRLQNTRTVVEAALLDANSMLDRTHVQQDVLEKLSCELNRLIVFLDERSSRACHDDNVTGGRGFMKEASLFFSASNQLVARFKDARIVKDIRKKLDYIARDHAQFGGIVEVPSRRRTQGRAIQTAGSYISTDVVVGRELERNIILSTLFDNSMATETFSVASIVGIGGIGKTTLARYVYHDIRVKQYFDVQFWVSGGQDFQFEEELKKMLAAATTYELPHNCSMDELNHHFLQAIYGKKFLLVLDNMWDQDSLRLKWLELRRLLGVGASGSKVLITTRSHTVAVLMDSTKPFMLGDLTQSDSWHLFEQIAFTQLQEPGVKTIGKEIAKMCPKVPLVIRSIGGLLAGKHTLQEWQAFRDDQLANFSSYGRDIMQTLKLSYDQLDVKLKLCVAYCSLFPKGFQYEKDEMIRLWISLGYIEPQYVNQSLEDAGDAYLLRLLNCGIFQESRTYEFSCHMEMHDIVHDVVLMLTGYKYKMAESNTVQFDERVRHVSVHNVVDSCWNVLSSLGKINYLESFLVVPSQKNITMRDFSVYNRVMLPRFQCMKILDLHGIWIHKLPASLGELICLRYLDLSETAIVRLPNSITRLVNLLSLLLHSCINLQELPKDMSKLIKLRYLQLSGNLELTHMPVGLGNLTDLQTLDMFVVSDQSPRSKFRTNAVGRLADLNRLNNLKGELSILVCRQTKDIVLEATVANLKMKGKLTDLSIEFWESTKKDDMVLEALQPHPNLQYLKIWGYGCESLPRWMVHNDLQCILPNLIQIKILNCKGCRYLCSLGRLSHLKELYFEGLDNVEYIEKITSSRSDDKDTSDSIMGELSPAPLFPSLEKFRLKGIPKLKQWRMRSSSADQDVRQHHNVKDNQKQLVEWKPPFPKLKALTVDNIALAITVARDLGFATLENLYISESLTMYLPPRQQQTSTPLNSFFPNLRCLHFSGDPEIEALPEEFQELSSLKYLRISNCKKLKAIPEWIDSLSSLTSLGIWQCPKLDSLPRRISNLSWLSLLSISGCSRVLSEKCRCKNPTGEFWPYIQHIPYIKIRLSDVLDDVNNQVWIV